MELNSRILAYKTLNLLDQRRAIVRNDCTAFYVWKLAERMLIIFDVDAVDIGKINQDFAHRLSTSLEGRLVVRTNSRGLFLQVDPIRPTPPEELIVLPLDMSRQPTPFHLPIGMTAGGGMWISLLEGDSFLVAGSRGLGKTAELHGWIQALLHGGKTQVYAFDGKRGVEFSRYIGDPNFKMVFNLSQTLTELKDMAKERRNLLLKSGRPNILAYNASSLEPITPAALFVDEAALTNDAEKALLVEIVERERDTGFYPILATNRPEAAALLVKTNLVTRICFPVPSWNSSQMVLGMNGAESLPKIVGRGLIVFKAKVTEFQSFGVTYPDPKPEAVTMLLEQEQATLAWSGDQHQTEEPTASSEIVRLAESIRSRWSSDLSKRKTAELFGKTYAGSWTATIDKVIEYLSATTTTKGDEMTDFAPEMA